MSNLFDVIVIGAGPAGCICAGILNKAGKKVLIIEKSIFPRFSIGESLLPQCMEYFTEANLESVFDTGYQLKNGAIFMHGSKKQLINFAEKSTAGPATTYQVQRDKFDWELTQRLQQSGVKIIFGHQVTSINQCKVTHQVNVSAEKINQKLIYQYSASFIVDASGLGRVLPRLLKLPIHHSSDQRTSIFGHILTKQDFIIDKNKILILTDQENRSTWFWVIPLTKNKHSIGVTTSDPIEQTSEPAALTRLFNQYLDKNPEYKKIIGEFKFTMDVKMASGYNSAVNTVYGDYFILIGNAHEFIDPVFSSGVTIAVKSASLAAKLILKKLQNQKVDWESDYKEKLNSGIEVFRQFILAWNRGDLQKIIFASNQNERIKSMVISILAGYAWDKENFFHTRTAKKIQSLLDTIS